MRTLLLVIISATLLVGCSTSPSDLQVEGDKVTASRDVYKNFNETGDDQNFVVIFNRK